MLLKCSTIIHGVQYVLITSMLLKDMWHVEIWDTVALVIMHLLGKCVYMQRCWNYSNVDILSFCISLLYIE